MDRIKVNVTWTVNDSEFIEKGDKLKVITMTGEPLIGEVIELTNDTMRLDCSKLGCEVVLKISNINYIYTNYDLEAVGHCVY